MKIHSLHIQTIAQCNSKCVMCPNGYIKMSGKKMDDWIFLKIIQETLPYMTENADYNLFLQNEPLLDKDINKKAQLIKSINQNFNTYISTNGILLPKFENDLQYFNRVLVSNYGLTLDDFNRVTRSNINVDTFNKFKATIQRNKFNNIENNTKFDENWKSDKEIKSCFTSRAGFLSNNKIIHKTSNIICKKKRYTEWLNFLADGTVILCCMDYTREAVVGNIKHQTIKEILDSTLFKNITRKAAGLIDSEEDFICKKCEQNIAGDY